MESSGVGGDPGGIRLPVRFNVWIYGFRFCGFLFWMVPRPNVEEGSCTSKDGCLIVSWTGLDSPRPYWAALRANLCTRHEFHNTNIHIDIHIYIG